MVVTAPWITVTDMGFSPGGGIRLIMYEDGNANGARGPDEPFLAQVAMDLLYDSDGDGTFETTVLSLTGATEFNLYQIGRLGFGPPLNSGSYRIVVNESTLPTDAHSLSSGSNPQTLIVNAPHVTVAQEMGFAPGGGIRLIMYEDLNANRVRNTGENLLDQVAMDLLYDSDGDGIYETTVLSLNGATEFNLYQIGRSGFGPPLKAGAYRIVVDESTLPTPAHSLSSGFNPKNLQVNAPGITVANEMGFAPGGGIRLIIYEDNNGNGVRDAGEALLDQLAVDLLYDGDGDGTYETTLLSLTGATEFSLYQIGRSGFGPPLKSGAYRIVVNESTLPTPDHTLTSGSNPQDLVVDAPWITVATEIGYVP